MHIFEKKKPMKQIAFLSAPVLLTTQAAAHPGAHVHPHDGASWLTVVGALAVLALAGGLAAANAKLRR